MLLQELTGVKRFHKYTQSELYKILRRLGIHIVSGGSYGTILTNDKWNYVVKLFNNDPYYLSFVQYATKHPNQHYPRFGRAPLQMHAFHTREDKDADKMWLLKIEKLQPLDKHTANFIVNNIEQAGTLAYWLDTEDTRAASKEHLDYLPDHAGPRTYFDGTKKKVTPRQWAADHAWLISLARAYNAIFENDDVIGSPDLHGKNFMKREDGTIVIIDPVWEGSTPYKEYDAWYRSMTDADANDHYNQQPMIQGPRYAKHTKPQSIQPKQQQTRQDIEDDIPF